MLSIFSFWHTQKVSSNSWRDYIFWSWPKTTVSVVTEHVTVWVQAQRGMIFWVLFILVTHIGIIACPICLKSISKKPHWLTLRFSPSYYPFCQSSLAFYFSFFRCLSRCWLAKKISGICIRTNVLDEWMSLVKCLAVQNLLLELKRMVSQFTKI